MFPSIIYLTLTFALSSSYGQQLMEMLSSHKINQVVQSVNESRQYFEPVVRIGIIIDEEDGTINKNAVERVFYNAVALSENSTITHFGSSVDVNISVRFEPVFFTSNTTSKEFTDKVIQTDGIMAMIDVTPCSAELCLKMNSLSVAVTTPLTVLSPCCFDMYATMESEEGFDDHHDIPDIIFTGQEPHHMADFFISMAKTFNWRRFHFVISPNNPSFETFYDLMEERIIEMGNGYLLPSVSLYCTKYFIKRNMCKEGQAEEIASNKATVIGMLLDVEGDSMADFLNQLKQVQKMFVHGKAFFLILQSGNLGRIIHRLWENAPDGLMVIEAKPMNTKLRVQNEFYNFETSSVNLGKEYDLSYSTFSMSLTATTVIRGTLANPVKYNTPSLLLCESSLKCKLFSSSFFFFFF